MDATKTKIAIYIVTYKNDQLLNRCLDSIFRSHIPDNILVSVNVINNYRRVQLEPPFQDYVTILNNDLRPEQSTGHLARNWNQAIMKGFRDINNPSNDLLILCQNDVVFCPSFITYIIEQTSKYDYIALGRGDEVQVMNTKAIKKIGMYDERFCNIGFQEADYFLRARILHKDKVSINDGFHGREWNPIDDVFGKILHWVPTGDMRKDEPHILSRQHHETSERVFHHKWGHSHSQDWDNTNISQITEVPPQYMFYPYFERQLPDLEKKYVIY